MEIKCEVEKDSYVEAMISFLMSRPIIYVSYFVFRAMCFIYFSVGCYLLSANLLSGWHTVTFTFATLWLFFSKSLLKNFISNIVNTKSRDYNVRYVLGDRFIDYFPPGKVSERIFVDNLRYVIKKKDGYVIPLPGMNNAGRFIFLPIKSLTKPLMENVHNLFLMNKVKVKKD